MIKYILLGALLGLAIVLSVTVMTIAIQSVVVTLLGPEYVPLGFLLVIFAILGGLLGYKEYTIRGK